MSITKIFIIKVSCIYKLFYFTILINIIFFCRFQYSFGTLFLAIPGSTEIHLQMEQSIPDDVITSAFTVDDIITYIWEMNKKGTSPLGVNLQLYPKRYGQFAIYYLIADLRKHFSKYSFYRDPGPATFPKRINKIVGKKLYQVNYITTNHFYKLKAFFVQLLDNGTLKKSKDLKSFSHYLSEHDDFSKLYFPHVTKIASDRETFALFLNINIEEVPKGWHIPYISLTVEQIVALEDLFRPKVEDGTIKQYIKLSKFLEVIDQDDVLKKVNLGHLTGAVKSREKFALVLDVDVKKIPKKWNIPYINLTAKQLKALQDLFRPKIAHKSLKCMTLYTLVQTVRHIQLLRKVNIGHLTLALGTREKFAELMGFPLSMIPREWNIPIINFTAKQLEALQNRFRPRVDDDTIGQFSTRQAFLADIYKDKVLKEMNPISLLQAVRHSDVFGSVLGVAPKRIDRATQSVWFISTPKLDVLKREIEKAL